MTYNYKKARQYYIKNIDKIKKYHLNYYNENKENIAKKYRKYYKENRKIINERTKLHYRKNSKFIVKKKEDLYKKAVKRICDYYNITKPICFVDKKEFPFRTKGNGNNFIVLEHKNEKISNSNDGYRSSVLYKYIISCPTSELENYQFLCSKHNVIKHWFYSFYLKLKNKNSNYKEQIYNFYNQLFIYDKNKLKNELLKKEKVI